MKEKGNENNDEIIASHVIVRKLPDGITTAMSPFVPIIVHLHHNTRA